LATPEADAATLVLTGNDVRDVLDMDECIAALEHVFTLHASGAMPRPGVLGMEVGGGSFHVKAAAAPLARSYFAAKTNGNFPDNPSRRRLPTIQGVIVLSDAANGRVLALLDSIEITALRTGAATAVAAKHLARADSAVVTIVGCGVQGRVQLRALSRVLPLARALAVDADAGAARRFADEMSDSLGIAVTPMGDLTAATLASDVCVTCTPARTPIVGAGDIRPGTFVAAVGADHDEKQEIHPDLFRDATVVVDVLDQCLAIGDLHHAVAAGAIAPHEVHGELGEIVAGTKPGRSTVEERTLFDSTGTALQDVAAAALAYERAKAAGLGTPIVLAAGPPLHP